MNIENFLLGIFSGIGNKLFDKKDKDQKLTIENHNHIQLSEVAQNISLDETTEVAGMVRRLNEFLRLLNENRYDRFTIAKLAQIMELKSIGELENYFKGKSEPNFEFLERFCDIFSINKDWLIEGKSKPFYCSKQTNYDPYQYLKYILESNPEIIYFIRSNSKIGETFIVLKFNDWKFEVLHRIWHISSHVGSGGESQIYGMYKLIMALKRKVYLKCNGRILPQDKFDLIFSGEIFPGSIIEYGKMQESPWWDDFTDVYHQFSISTSYGNWYGEEFLHAQRTIRYFLK